MAKVNAFSMCSMSSCSLKRSARTGRVGKETVGRFGIQAVIIRIILWRCGGGRSLIRYLVQLRSARLN